MVLGVSWKEKISNEVPYGRLSRLSDKIKSRRLKLARHPEILANDLVLWEPEVGSGEDLESCRRLPECTLDGFITKLLGIFNMYKFHCSVFRNLSITITIIKFLFKQHNLK